MKTSLVLLSALFACAFGAPRNDGRIINGGTIVPHSLPFVVALEQRGSVDDPWVFGSGGSLLEGGNWILTAASAVDDVTDVANLRVLAGLHDRKNPDAITKLGVPTQIRKHPDYNATTMENDIAVIWLQNRYTLDGNINIIRLPNGNDNPPGGTQVSVAGWGNTADGTFATGLQSANIAVVDDVTCLDNYADVMVDINATTTICAGGATGACVGDEGQALFTGNGQQSTIHGVFSWVSGCGDATKPGIYTRVGPYVAWINANRPA